MRNDVITNLITRVDRMFEECRDRLKKTTHQAHRPVYEAKLRGLTACQDVLKNPSDLEKLEALKAAYEEAIKKGDSGANGKLTFFEQVRFKDSDVVDVMLTVIFIIKGRNENTFSVSPTVNAPF